MIFNARSILEDSELEPDPEMNVKAMAVSERVWLANGGFRCVFDS